MKQRFSIFVLLVLLAINTFAVTSSYYSSVDNKSGVTLFNALTSLTTSKQTTTLSYAGLWTAYKTTDTKSNGTTIWDMYSNCTFTYSTSQCGSATKECACYNREHSLPKSWWGGTTSGPYTDIFHVVPTDGYVNNMRSNYPFGEVKTASKTSDAGCKLGTSNISSYSGTVFEPQDEYKGDFARAYMAMCVRWANTTYKFTSDYGNSTFNTTFTSAGNYGLTAYGVALLMKWHRQDPVSQKEIDRNNGIETVQGNRNPFIDYPCLAEYIWGEHKDETFKLANTVGSFESGFTPGTSTGCSTSSSTTKSTPTITFNNPTTSLTVGASVTNVATSNSTGAITYKSSSTSVATVNATTGAVTAASAGTTTITATVAETASYYSASATYTLTVTTSSSGGDTGSTGEQTTYTKLTSAPTDWAGEYLIVCESQNVILDGSRTTLDAVSNTQAVTISNSTITTSNSYSFTIAASGTSYTIKSASGYYIGRDASTNGLNSSTTTGYLNTLSIASGVATIQGAGNCYLRFNSTSGQTRFRYFQSNTTNNNIALYKKNTTSTTKSTPTIAFNNPTTSLTVGESATSVATSSSTGAITYKSSSTGVATVNSTTGAVNALSAGTTTITATVAETSKYYSASANYTLTVKAAETGGGSTDVTEGDYVKVTENLADWSGDYVIVFEDSKDSCIIYNGAAITTGLKFGNGKKVAVANYTVSAEDGDPCKVTIAKATSGYTFQTASGYYIGGPTTAANDLLYSTTTSYVNTITYDTDHVNIIGDGGGCYMRYNNTTSAIFRYYKSTSYAAQNPVQLYKKDDGATTTLARVENADNIIYFTEANTLHISGMEQGAVVTIFDCSGRVIFICRSSNTNEVFSLGRGIYIVNIKAISGAQTFKIAL